MLMMMMMIAETRTMMTIVMTTRMATAITAVAMIQAVIEEMTMIQQQAAKTRRWLTQEEMRNLISVRMDAE
jgi:hypothetical protein